MTTYCPACGINVETTLVTEPTRQVWRCANCHLALKVQPVVGEVVARIPLTQVTPAELARRKEPPVDPPPLARANYPATEILPGVIDDVELDGNPDDPLEVETSAAYRAAPAPARFETLLLGDASQALRAVLSEQIRERRIADRVEPCASGEELLTRATEQLSTGGRIDLLILDVDLPVLNGYQAAIALRAVERGLRVPVPTPLIFFTARACDETFRKVLEYIQPARYLSKGDDAAHIPERLVSVLAGSR